jgi:hypothetical protein
VTTFRGPLRARPGLSFSTLFARLRYALKPPLDTSRCEHLPRFVRFPVEQVDIKRRRNHVVDSLFRAITAAFESVTRD